MSTANKAVKNEADDNEIMEFEFDGDKYTYESKMTRNLKVLEAFEDEKIIKAVRLILGPRQWAQFNVKDRDDSDFEAICEAMFAATGVKAGESAG